MKNRYVAKIEREILNIFDSLSQFPDYKKYLKYDWHKWSDGYGDNYTIRKKKSIKKKFFFLTYTTSKNKNVVHDLSARGAENLYKALKTNKDEIFEAINEAKTYILIKEKEVECNLIDFNVTFKGVQDTVKELLARGEI